MAAIRREDIITDDALKAPNELAANFDKVAASILKVAEAGKAANANIEGVKSVKELKKETNDLSDRQKELNKINKKIEIQQARNNKEYAQQQSELKKLREASKRLVEEEKELVGTEEKLRDQSKKLKEERKKLNLETKEGIERLKEINDQLDENDERLKELSSSLEKQKTNVGNYRGSLEDLFSTLQEASQSEGGIKNLFTSFVSGAKSATIASLKFIATPIGAILAAIVALFIAYNKVLNTNTETGLKLQKIWGGFKDILNVIIGRVIKLATAYIQLISLDFKGAAQSASEAFSDLGESLEKAYDRGVKFVELEKKLNKTTAENVKTVSELERELNKYNQIAGDATISLNAQNDAALKASEMQVKITEQLIKEARLKTEIAAIELERAKEQGNSTEAQLNYNTALAEENRILGENEVALLENATLRRQILQDNKELELDFLIDHLDNTKTINEKIIANENASMKVRREMLETLVDIADKSFQDQIKLLQGFAKAQIDVNKLLEENDPLLLYQYINKELGLSEILTTRLLEVIRERKLLMRDIVDLQIQLNGEVKKLHKINDEVEFSLISKDELDESLNNLKSHLDKIAAAEAAALEKRLALREEFESTIKKMAQDTFFVSVNLIHGLADEKAASIERENETIQAGLDTQLEAAEGNEERQAEINEQKRIQEEKTQREVAKIRKRQAMLDKAIALAEIVFNTRRAVMLANATWPPPTNIPWVSLALAMGAIQAAAVIAQPIPQFAKGTESSPEGLAIVNEKGSELMVTPQGQLQMINTDTPTLTYLKKGTKVIPADETKQLINGAIGGIKVENTNNAPSGNFAVLQELMRLNKTVAGKKEVHMNFDRHAVEFWTKKGHVWTKIMNQDYA